MTTFFASAKLPISARVIASSFKAKFITATIPISSGLSVDARNKPFRIPNTTLAATIGVIASAEIKIIRIFPWKFALSVGLRANAELKPWRGVARMVPSLGLRAKVSVVHFVPPQIIVETKPGLSRKAIDEALSILHRMFDLGTIGLATTGTEGAALRRSIGVLLLNAETWIRNFTIGTELANVFELMRAAGASMDNFDRIRSEMINIEAAYEFADVLRMSGIVLSMVEQCQIISATEFTSRDEVELLMQRMSVVFEEVKLEVSYLLDGVSYPYVVELSGATMQHLAATERKLPRIVEYTMPSPLPSLTLANRIYADASRAEEIAAENSVIHPAFCPIDLRVLSN